MCLSDAVFCALHPFLSYFVHVVIPIVSLKPNLSYYIIVESSSNTKYKLDIQEKIHFDDRNAKVSPFLFLQSHSFFTHTALCLSTRSLASFRGRRGGRKGGYTFPNIHTKKYIIVPLLLLLELDLALVSLLDRGGNVTNDVEFTTGNLIIIFSAKVYTHRYLLKHFFVGLFSCFLSVRI